MMCVRVFSAKSFFLRENAQIHTITYILKNIILNYFMVEHINQDRTKCFVLFRAFANIGGSMSVSVLAWTRAPCQYHWPAVHQYFSLTIIEWFVVLFLCIFLLLLVLCLFCMDALRMSIRRSSSSSLSTMSSKSPLLYLSLSLHAI